MSTLYFIRHGQASFGKENYDLLSPIGEIQSRLLAGYLFKSGVRFDLVYCGTMERQKKTASVFIEEYNRYENFAPDVLENMAFNEHDTMQIFTAALPILRAEDPGIEKYLNNIYSDKKSFQTMYERSFGLWIKGRCEIPGTGSYNDFARNVNSALDSILREHGKGKTIALFTSGGPIAAVVRRALELSGEMAMKLQWQIANTSITRFKTRDEAFSLVSFNNYAHLESENSPGIITFR